MINFSYGPSPSALAGEGMICALDQLTLATNARPRKSIFFNIASWVLNVYKLGEIQK